MSDSLFCPRCFRSALVGPADEARGFCKSCAKSIDQERDAHPQRLKRLRRMGNPGTLRLEYEGSQEFPEGLYDGHDLHRADMVVYSVGATPREAILALCKVRLGMFGGTLTELPKDPERSDLRFTWGYRFTADGTGCKAAGIYVPGGVILTWWK